MNIKRIKKMAAEMKDEIISIRHHLHANPELSFQEKQTAAFISGKLNEWNIPHQTHFSGNGIVGIIQGKNAGKKCIALRADMDALPILEKNKVGYHSQNEGVMHACGHDVHSSSLLGTIKILHSLKESWSGSVKFIFQPAEEKLPGGASLMIRDGVLTHPKPDVILAQHVYTPLTVGSAGFRGGMYMASADEIYITVKGKGSHAADSSNASNALFLAAELLIELKKISDEASSKIPTILTFGKIAGSGATNVIPEGVTIDGTLRTLDESWRKVMHEKLKSLATNFYLRHKTEVSLRIETGYPCLVNDEKTTALCKSFAQQYLGEENILDLDIRMASEDFAFYSQEISACFYRIGTGNPSKGITSSVHTSTFNIDEDALEIASGMMAWMTVQLLVE